MSRPRRNLQQPKYHEDSDSASFSEDFSEDPPSNASYILSTAFTKMRQSARIDPSIFEPLSQTDIKRAHEQIKRDLTTIENIDVQHAQLKKAHGDIKMRLKATAQCLFKKRAKISAMQRLPLEIFGVIFLFNSASSKSPWNIMHVCRIWRRAAFLTPQLWSGIVLQSGSAHIPGRGARRRMEGKERCCNPLQLKRALGRARGTPLQLKTDCGQPPTRPTKKLQESERKHFWRMLSMVSCAPNPIASYESTGWEALRRSLITAPLDLSGLLSLRMNKGDAEFLHRVDAQSLRLCSVSWYGAIEGVYQWPSRLSTLLVNQGGCGPNGHLSLVKTVLSQAQSLTSLEISSIDSSIPESYQQVLEMPVLQTLILDFASMPSIHCPQLSSCTLRWSTVQIGDLRNRSHKSSGALSCPNLRSLVLMGESQLNCTEIYLPMLDDLTFDGFPPFLINLDAPAVDILHVKFPLQVYNKEESILKEWREKESDQPYSMAVKLLSVSLTGMSLRILVELLRKVRTVQALHLYGTLNGASVFGALEPLSKKARASEGNGDTVLCSDLIFLKVCLSHSTVKNQSAVLKAAKKAVKARVMAGYWMEEASIRFTEDSDWISLLGEWRWKYQQHGSGEE